MLSFFPRDVLDEILNLIESVSEGFPSYSCICRPLPIYLRCMGTHPSFSTMFSKGSIFVFSSLLTWRMKSFRNGVHTKTNKSSNGSSSFFYTMTEFYMGGNKVNDRVASS